MSSQDSEFSASTEPVTENTPVSFEDLRSDQYLLRAAEQDASPTLDSAPTATFEDLRPDFYRRLLEQSDISEEQREEAERFLRRQAILMGQESGRDSTDRATHESILAEVVTRLALALDESKKGAEVAVVVQAPIEVKRLISKDPDGFRRAVGAAAAGSRLGGFRVAYSPRLSSLRITSTNVKD